MKISSKASNMELRTPVITRESESMSTMSSFINLNACEIGKRYIILLGRLPKRECVFFLLKKNLVYGNYYCIEIFFPIKKLWIFVCFEFD